MAPSSAISKLARRSSVPSPPAANLRGANGAATITIDLKDDGLTANGGEDTSAAQTFTITINPVNDAPSFAKVSAVMFICER